MSKVLVTGFGPYGVTPVNPAQLTAEELDGRTIAGATVISRIVPNTFFESIAAAQQAIAEIEPALVIMLGEYPGRSMITVERLAQNVNDCGRYGLADCAGRVLVGEPTDPAGPVAYHATVPVRAMVLAMRKAGVPADVSDAAGTFVCNHLSTACCTTSPRRVCPSAPVGFICRACPASPHWITTSVFRACRSRRRSPGSRLASRQPFGSPQISANRSRRDCRSRAQLTAVF
ncbi:pyroglutamyl-peptidase I [Mycobacterium tuberculosis]|uniref:pyroglutamyl-peptidase I n=1 Tax=Mycobacterium tuberculosis TaxID=1773 RepID=UPI000B1A4AA4